MQESKYFYNGVPLAEYCQENGINVTSIRTRIWKKKKSGKYSGLTDQEIVNMVVEVYGSAIKYRYKNQSLRQYCLDNGINITTIISRIKRLRKKHKSLSDDELVTLAMEKFDNQNYRFFYKGIPLKQYCESHPEIRYSTIQRYINNEKQKNPELSDEELIQRYLDKEHKGIYKFYYCGIPLKQYCDDNGLNYRNIVQYMRQHRDDECFKNLTGDEYVETVINQYQPFAPKYLYKGLALWEYCKQNSLSYSSVVSFVKRNIAKGSKKSIDDLIDEGIKTINRYGIIYYYKGMPLKDYAKQNNLNVKSIRCAILRKRSSCNKPLQEIIDLCVETYQRFSIKYYYNGIPLTTYCNKIGLNYNTVIHKYLDEYAGNPDIGIEDAIKQIVDYYIAHPPARTKYFFSNQSLARFCDVNGYPYLAIWRRIKTLEMKECLSDSEHIIKSAIKKYENRVQIDEISRVFDKLKSGKIIEEDEIKDICDFLKIDFENVTDLIGMGFSYNQAINMIWYFFDKKTEEDFKLITNKKIEVIFSLIDNLKNANGNVKQFELYDLIGIYKSGLYDSRNEIILRQKRYICKTIYTLCGEYNIEVNNSNFEDFESEIKYYLLILINRINLNIYGQIIKYMNLTVKGYFREYLKRYIEQNKSLSLDEAKFFKDRGTRNGKSRLDYIESKNDFGENIEEISFSTGMKEALSSLPQEDIMLIILKYQEDYSDEDLSQYFKLPIDEIKNKEIKILLALKNNASVRELKDGKQYKREIKQEEHHE